MSKKEYQRRRYEEEYRPAYAALMSCYPFTLDDLDGEEWRDIAGYKGIYQVSTFGRVKSFWKSKAKILKPALDMSGYLYLGLKRNGQNHNFKIHRLVAEAFLSNVEANHEVNHKDTHKLNDYVGNLEWVTHAENMKHAAKAGALKAGEERYGALLKNRDIIYIRENPDGLSMNQLAEKLGVSPAKISEVQLGRKYKNVDGAIRNPFALAKKYDTATRAQICSEYIKGDSQFGMHALAKKYKCNATTIWRIVHGQD